MARTVSGRSKLPARRPAGVGFGLVEVVRRVWKVNVGRFVCCFVAASGAFVTVARIGRGPTAAADLGAAAILIFLGSVLLLGVFIGRRFDRTTEDFFRTDAACVIGYMALVTCVMRLFVGVLLG